MRCFLDPKGHDETSEEFEVALLNGASRSRRTPAGTSFATAAVREKLEVQTRQCEPLSLHVAPPACFCRALSTLYFSSTCVSSRLAKCQ